MESSFVLPGSNSSYFSSYEGHNQTTRARDRGPTLHRGAACHMCRRRKMKCDAGRPFCGPCKRSGDSSACQYDDSKALARISKLEEENRTLRERIFMLANRPLQESRSSTQETTSFLSEELPTAPSRSVYTGADLASLHPIQPHSLEQLMAIFEQIAVAQFAFPKSTITLLAGNPRGGASALQEAACAAACAVAKINNGGISESTFMKRAFLAFASLDDDASLQDIQAMVVCAVLAFASGRILQGQRNLGSALRIARFCGRWSKPGLNLVDARETWWMLWHAERAWAPIVGDLGISEVMLGPFLLRNDYVLGDIDYMMDSEEFRNCHAASLAARAWTLAKDAWEFTQVPVSWQEIESTTAALESVLSLATCPSTRLVAASALAVLHYGVKRPEPSLYAAKRAANALVGEDVERMNAVVGWWMVKVLHVVRHNGASEAQGIIELAVKRAAAAWGYMDVALQGSLFEEEGTTPAHRMDAQSHLPPHNP